MAAVFSRHSSSFGSPYTPYSPYSPHSRRQSNHFEHFETFSNGGYTNGHSQSFSRRLSSKRFSKRPSTNITSVVTSLKDRSSDELGPAASSNIFNVSHDSILEWISAQRMTLLPPEGSDHDKVLSWAHLFVERLHSFDVAIEEFAGDSYLASQLAYGYCAMLLELGNENATALTTSFGFFQSISMPFLNLLERAELFSANHEIREQLVFAFGDLVTLVASVSIHFNKAIRGLNGSSVSIDIYSSFSEQIRTFRQRCEKISNLLWGQQLLKENVPPEKVADISMIKSWLAPGDPVVASVADSASHLAHEREELTCLWVAPYVSRFLASDSQILSVSGKPGSGKTVLASVAVDHLQHPIAGVNYSTLYIPINARVPAGTSPRAIASTILSQLFSKRIGNVQLYQILSDAYSRSKLITDESEYDELLWSTLETALGSSVKGAAETVLVVDGLDEASCGEKLLMNNLISATSSARNVKLITFGTEKVTSTAQHVGVHIDGDWILDDISTIVRSHLMVKGPFSELDEIEKETLVSRLVDAANGSFVWSKLVAKRVRGETKPDGLRKAIDTIVSEKPSLTDLVSKTVADNDVSVQAKYMLLWLATAERPLYVKELATLLSVDVEKLSASDQEVDVLHILKSLKSLIYLDEGLIYLRHAVIRTAVQEIFSKGTLIPNLKDRHADLSTRLLAYVKSTFIQQRDISLSPTPQGEAESMLHKHRLLDFALRYWPLHLRNTLVFSKDGARDISKEVQKVLPASVAVVQLQNRIWVDSLSTPLLFTYSTVESDIYKDTLTPKHAVSLQSIIFQAQLLRQLGRTQEATFLFHQAAMTSYSVLSTQNIVTMQLMRVFLELTTDQVSSSKTEIMTQREQVLTLLVECYKVHYGTSSESIVTVWRQLSEHYRMTKDIQKAQQIEASIQSITQSGTEQHETGDTKDSLAVKLRARRESGSESRQTLILTDEHDEKVDSSESRFNLSTSLETVQKYISEQRYELAESVYIEMWQQTIQESRSSTSIQTQERVMKSTLEYSAFLQSQGRINDAASILSSFWQDFNVGTLQSETTLVYLRDVAKLLKTVNLPLMALTVFRKLATQCETTNNTKTSLYKEIIQSIQTTIKEILEASTTSVSIASESTLESLIIETAQSPNGVDPVVFSAAESLSKRYEEQHLWRNATRLIKGVLSGVWPSLFSDSLENVSLPAKHADHCIRLARRLSQCYRFRRRSSKEKDIYVRIYRVLRSTRKVEDPIRKEVTSELLRCYESNSETDMVITVHEELLSDYTQFYGSEHATVVKQLWTLANLTRPRPVSLEYYQQIIRILNKDIGAKVCHPDAFEPVNIVASEMWTQSRYADALNFYKLIFTAFLEHNKLSPKLQDSGFVREAFDRYVHCLRAQRADFATLHGVMTAYRNKCKAIFGASATVTVLSTLTLARLCQESKRFEKDAISLYEELLKIESDSISHTEITSILEALYEDHRAITSQQEGQSQQVVQRVKERFTSTRQTYGWAHEESLTQLTEMINVHITHQDTSTAVSELNEATSQILSSTTSTTALSNAASTIATGYVAVGQRHKAIDLTNEIYRQIIFRDTSNAQSYKFDLSSKGHSSLMFLAQMKHSLTHQSTSITEILATLKTEMTYFEEFERVIKTKDTSLQTVLTTSSRLYYFLVEHGNEQSAQRVLIDLKSHFIKTEGKRIQLTEQNQVHELLVTLLEYVRVYQVRDLTRSVGIAGNERVVQLLKQHRFDAAINLANATFKYLSAQRTYRTPEVVKFVFMLGLGVSGRSHITKPEQAVNKRLISVSAAILQDALAVVHELKLNIALMDADALNSTVSILGEQQSYKTLTWLLGILWNSRDVHQTWQAGTILTLGRRYIMARYLVGDVAAAVRLAEDIVYNVRRVHGARHPSALDMSVLLSQIYTGMAQKYQAQKGGAELAKRFYKKSAAVHENILRAFTDVELDMTIDGSMSDNGHSLDLDFINHSAADVSPGERVKRHFRLFKLAVQRLGGWPKEYAEYERLNADLYREFPTALKGVEGIERWEPRKMGEGRAESDEDLVDAQGGVWALYEVDEFYEAGVNGIEEEEL